MLKKLRKFWTNLKRRSPLYHAGYQAGLRARDRARLANSCPECGFFKAWTGNEQNTGATPSTVTLDNPARMGNFDRPVGQPPAEANGD